MILDSAAFIVEGLRIMCTALRSHLKLSIHPGSRQVAQFHPGASCWQRDLPQKAVSAMLRHRYCGAYPWRSRKRLQTCMLLLIKYCLCTSM